MTAKLLPGTGKIKGPLANCPYRLPLQSPEQWQRQQVSHMILSSFAHDSCLLSCPFHEQPDPWGVSPDSLDHRLPAQAAVRLAQADQQLSFACLAWEVLTNVRLGYQLDVIPLPSVKTQKKKKVK